jgi:hypothetical protein
MKTYEIVLLALNFANSLFMAFVLTSIYIQQPHAVTLIEPNSFIITAEAITAISVVALTASVGAWKLRTTKTKNGANLD